MHIFNIIYTTWFASEVLLNIIFHPGRNDKKGRDKNSLIFIWIVLFFAIYSGVYISGHFKLLISNHYMIRYMGLVIIVLGMILRFFSIWSLGRFFTVVVTIREGHKLKKDGVYKILRHPSYTGALLSFIGFGISLNNWLSLIITNILMLAVSLYRIKIEEKTLTEHFGKEYLDYKNSIYCILPWIY